MFRFTIRDVLWLTVVVGLGLMWRVEHDRAQREIKTALDERDAAIKNEHRLADLKAREMAGTLISESAGRYKARGNVPLRAPVSP
jgi:hypothetical protein